MYGFTLMFVGLVLAGDSKALQKDVYSVQSRHFEMPLQIDAARRDKISTIRLFVSENSGKTWHHKADYKRSDTKVMFLAPRDGMYWFAVQVVLKDEDREPADPDDLVPLMKVFVNSQRRALQTQKSYEELQNEVDQLRKRVKKLQQKIKELESDRQSK